MTQVQFNDLGYSIKIIVYDAIGKEVELGDDGLNLDDLLEDVKYGIIEDVEADMERNQEEIEHVKRCQAELRAMHGIY